MNRLLVLLSILCATLPATALAQQDSAWARYWTSLGAVGGMALPIRRNAASPYLAARMAGGRATFSLRIRPRLAIGTEAMVETRTGNIDGGYVCNTFAGPCRLPGAMGNLVGGSVMLQYLDDLRDGTPRTVLLAGPAMYRFGPDTYGRSPVTAGGAAARFDRSISTQHRSTVDLSLGAVVLGNVHDATMMNLHAGFGIRWW